jgi:hypothetical protein
MVSIMSFTRWCILCSSLLSAVGAASIPELENVKRQSTTVPAPIVWAASQDCKLFLLENKFITH